MKKSTFQYFLAVLVAMLLSSGGATPHAQQTEQSDQSDTSTAKPKTKAKSESNAKVSTDDSTQSDSADSSKSKSQSKSKTKTSVDDSTPPTTASKPAPAPKPTTQQQRPANSDGMVWVNTDSGVYHKPGTRWYGKTKKGKYMTEADAIKTGYHAAKKE